MPADTVYGVDPISGLSWEDYFRAYNDQQAADKRAKAGVPDEDAEPAPESVVLAPGALATDLAALPGKPGTLARRLVAAGWEVRVGVSSTWQPPTLYATGSEEDAEEQYNAGDVRFEEHLLDFFEVMAVKRGGGDLMAFHGTWVRKSPTAPRKPGGMSFKGAKTYDPILGYEWRPTATKPRKLYFAELGVYDEGPLGFDQWLDIVCPKPEPKKRTKKENSQE